MKDSEPAIVGVLVMCGPDSNRWVTEELGTLGDQPRRHMRVLLAHSHTRELEFVEFGSLIPYGPPGGEAMPQPEKTK